MEKLEREAEAGVWKYVYGFSELRMVKCAVELGLPDAVESHGQPMSLSQLSSAVDCPGPTLFRVMRFLTHKGIFKKQVRKDDGVYYAQTPLSHLLTRENMGPLVLAQDGPDSHLSMQDLKAGKGLGSEPDDKLWSPEFGGEEFRRLLQDYFECHGRVTTASLINDCPEIFHGVSSLVDVGGRAGTSLGMLVRAFPWVRGINFDLPHVVSGLADIDRVEHVGGDMFEAVPTADAIMLMAVLHDWSDEFCIKILKNCKEAIAVDTGKVIIVDAIIDEDGEERNDEYSEVRLAQDIAIMIGTATGKERTAKEWAQLIEAAGFRSHTIKHIKAIESVILAYP